MNQKTETLVIGGGAIGICCAYYLHELGKNVTVVEKDDIMLRQFLWQCRANCPQLQHTLGGTGGDRPGTQMDVQSGKPLLHQTPVRERVSLVALEISQCL